MKKSIKILGLVLSLALICGALVVAAFASDSSIPGVTTIGSFDLESANVEDYPPANQMTSDRAIQSKVSTCYADRIGQISILKSENGENNYLLWTQLPGSQGSKTWSPYVYATVGTKPHVGADGAVTIDSLANYSYYVMDVDFRSPSGIVPKGTNFQYMFHYVKADGSVTNENNLAQSNVHIETNSQMQLCIYDDNDSASSMTVLENSIWNHLTFVIEVVKLEGSGVQLIHHAFLNGEYAWTVQGRSSYDESSYYNGNRSLSTVTEFRINFPTAVNSQGYCDEGEYETVAIDNFLLRSFSNEYSGNLSEIIESRASLSGWESNVYDADSMPFGVPMAKNLNTEKVYDSLQKAVDAASEGDIIDLLGDIYNTVSVQNTIQINSNGYNCPVAAVNPFMYTLDDNGVYYFEESSEKLTVNWIGCGHVEGCEDEAHPGGIETDVLLNGNIRSSYTKDHAWIYEDEESGLLYILSGWERGDTGELLTSDDTVDEALLKEGYIELYPIYVTTTYAYEYTNSKGESVKEYDTVQLADIITNAKAGTTVKLLSDITVNKTASVYKNLTVDLNGKTITSISSPTKYALFSTGQNITFTITTSQPGAKIFHGNDRGYSSSGAWQGYNGDPIVQGRKGTTVIIDGSAGLQTWSAVLYMAYGNAAGNLYINGGEYYNPKSISDHAAFLAVDAINYAEIKNATFWSHKNVLGFLGNGYVEAPTENSVVYIDNCAFLGGCVAQYDYKELEVTFTNCFIAGSLNVSNKFQYTRSGCRDVSTIELGGKWTLGEGNYLLPSTTLSSNVVLADGLVSYPVNAINSFSVSLNTFTESNIEKSKELTVSEETYAFNTYITKPTQPVKITWYDTDGVTVLGVTEDALPGMTATAPSTPVAAVDGWLNATYTQWTNPDGVETTAVPTGVTEYSFKLVEGSDAAYSVGTVPMYMNYELVLHFQLNVYIPKNAPEGIGNIAVKYNNDSVTPSGTWIIGGDEYSFINRWPNAAKADDDATVSVSFDYDGQSYTYTTLPFNIGDYSQEIFDGEYSTEMKQATLSMLRYVEAANKVTGRELSEDVASAIENAPVSITVDDVEAGEGVSVSDDFAAYVSSIQLVYNDTNGGIQFRFYKTQKGIDDAASINIIYNGYVNSKTADDSAGGKWPQTLNELGVAFWYNHNVRAYDFDNEMTVQVKVGDEVVAECTYSLAAYAAGVKAECSEDQWNLILTTIAFGKYTEAIKLG